ncbi:MAG: hypothetical protein NC826_00875 [Candidatus Omnitrophica bacterium]|nr:hypothetical protein [Candidatus Omnitrophota bacterium]
MQREILITGIGSMPHRKPQDAVDLIFKYMPYIPFWPQLPQRDIREGMCFQFSEGFSFLKEGLIYDRNSSEKELQDFYYHIINEDIDYFKISPDFAAGLYCFYERLKRVDLGNIRFIKTQITGPFTFMAAIKDKEGNLVLQDNILREAVVEGLIRKALWQMKFFKEFGKKIIIFFDEPYLSGFGSAYIPLNREEIIMVLSYTFDKFKELVFKKNILSCNEILVGVHCCGNTDWSIFTEVSSLDIISFDAFSFGDKLSLYSDNLKDFLIKGGFLCWGIFPTIEFDNKINKHFILDRLNYILDNFLKKGLSRKLILDNSILSPSCGLGKLDENMAQKIFSLISEFSQLLSDID